MEGSAAAYGDHWSRSSRYHPDRRGDDQESRFVSGESHGTMTTWAGLGGAPRLATCFAVSASVTPLPAAASTTHVTTRAEPGLPLWASTRPAASLGPHIGVVGSTGASSRPIQTGVRSAEMGAMPIVMVTASGGADHVGGTTYPSGAETLRLPRASEVLPLVSTAGVPPLAMAPGGTVTAGGVTSPVGATMLAAATPLPLSLMRPLPRILAFSGEETGDMFADWHDHFEKVSGLAGWDDLWRLVHLASSLKDTAAAFYRSCSGDVRNDYRSLVAANGTSSAHSGADSALPQQTAKRDGDGGAVHTRPQEDVQLSLRAGNP